MAEVYNKADEVLIWLGESYKNSDLMIAFIPKISTQNASQMIEDASNGSSWKALEHSCVVHGFPKNGLSRKLLLHNKLHSAMGMNESPG